MIGTDRAVGSRRDAVVGDPCRGLEEGERPARVAAGEAYEVVPGVVVEPVAAASPRWSVDRRVDHVGDLVVGERHRGEQQGAAGPISAILWGPPGTGKTTLAHLVATAADREFVELSAVTAGVKDVRAVMEHANRARDMYGRQTVLFLDEIHRFTKAQQDALLPGVENRQVVLVAATTENPSFSVIAPLLSRSMLRHPASRSPTTTSPT